MAKDKKKIKFWTTNRNEQDISRACEEDTHTTMKTKHVLSFFFVRLKAALKSAEGTTRASELKRRILMKLNIPRM